MTEALNSLLVDRSMDLHTLYKPNAFGLKDGLDIAFKEPHRRVKLLPTGGETSTSTLVDNDTVGAFTIEDGLFDLSSLAFVQTMRVTDAGGVNAPIAYDSATPTPASYIALQNGSALWANMQSVSIDIRGSALATYNHPWFNDIVTKYGYNSDSAESFGRMEGFVKDYGVADAMTDVGVDGNIGYAKRAKICRPGTAGASTITDGKFTLVCGADAIPLFREKRLVFLPKGAGITITFKLNAQTSLDIFQRTATSVATQRHLDNFYGEINQYFPTAATEAPLKALLMTTPQYFVYPDYNVITKNISACTTYSQDIKLGKGKINGVIIGFQNPDARNKRQFIPARVERVHLQIGTREYPETSGYALTTTAGVMKAYHNYLIGTNETSNGAGSILDFDTYNTTMRLYYFDLRRGPSHIAEAIDEINKGDTATLTVDFRADIAAVQGGAAADPQVATNMFAMVLSDAVVELHMDPNTPLKTLQQAK